MSTPAPSGAPDTGLAYHQILRAGRGGVGRPILGILTMLVGFFVIGPLVWSILAMAFFAVAGSDNISQSTRELVDTGNVTPGVLLFVNLVLIMGIPISWFCVRVFHEVRPRWLTSVAPRLRWRWFAVSFGLALVTLVFVVVLGSLLPGVSDGDAVSDGANAFTSTTRNFLIVILLSTPFQAAAEEYAFRGYLTQAFGGLFASRAVAVLAPALLFALAHGLGQSLPIFVDRFAFGVTAGLLVVLTGGLEAGIAYHVLNNVLAFVLALGFGDMTSVLTPSGGTWSDVVLSVVKSVVFVGLAVYVARRMGVRTRTSGAILEAPTSRV
jgi:membrane protease YdiL (CAAX protease family)